MKSKKLIVVINGRGGVGKDTLCGFGGREYKARSISAITPIKEIAAQYGWRGEKTMAARRFLAELKRVFIEYNDLPNRYLVGEARRFLDSGDELLFVHIRESDQIDAFRGAVAGLAPCVTLLVVRRGAAAEPYGNHADDDVEDYRYDYVFDNSAPLPESERAFRALLRRMMAECCGEGANA